MHCLKSLRIYGETDNETSANCRPDTESNPVPSELTPLTNKYKLISILGSGTLKFLEISYLRLVP